jgi:steroid 5-alpha reductase family enzyme
MNDTNNRNNNGKLSLAILIAVAVAAMLALAGSQHGARHVLIGLELPVFAWCGIIAFTINWLIFLPSWLAQTEHYFDLTGSLCFVSLMLIALTWSPGQDVRTVLLTVLVCIWATRLGGFLFLRIRNDGSDGRFDPIKPHFTRFLLTWTLQALWVFVTSAAALAAITSSHRMAMDPIAWAGVAIWILGFTIEVSADAQKRAFRASPENRGKFIQEGLWSWSRHPNYFGEIMLWVGIALIAAPVLIGWQWVTLVSPLFVVLLLTRISGIPMLEARAEKRWGNDPAFQAYKARTSRLLLRPPHN